MFEENPYGERHGLERRKLRVIVEVFEVRPGNKYGVPRLNCHNLTVVSKPSSVCLFTAFLELQPMELFFTRSICKAGRQHLGFSNIESIDT